MIDVILGMAAVIAVLLAALVRTAGKAKQHRQALQEAREQNRAQQEALARAQQAKQAREAAAVLPEEELDEELQKWLRP